MGELKELDTFEGGRLEGRRQVIERLCTYRIKKCHSRAYGNIYRLEIPIEDWEFLANELGRLNEGLR